LASFSAEVSPPCASFLACLAAFSSGVIASFFAFRAAFSSSVSTTFSGSGAATSSSSSDAAAFAFLGGVGASSSSSSEGVKMEDLAMSLHEGQNNQGLLTQERHRLTINLSRANTLGRRVIENKHSTEIGAHCALLANSDTDEWRRRWRGKRAGRAAGGGVERG